jgi:hypothetical protein
MLWANRLGRFHLFYSSHFSLPSGHHLPCWSMNLM